MEQIDRIVAEVGREVDGDGEECAELRLLLACQKILHTTTEPPRCAPPDVKLRDIELLFAADCAIRDQVERLGAGATE